MIRRFVLASAFLAFVVVETSFVSALPSVMALAPVTFAVGITLLQHHGVRAGALWIAAFGLALDASGLASAAPAFLPYALAAVAADAWSARVFSNRSFYGLLGCGIAAFGVLIGAEAVLLLLRSLFLHEPAALTALFADAAVSAIWICILLTVLFHAGGRFRRWFGSAFVMPDRKRTLA